MTAILPAPPAGPAELSPPARALARLVPNLYLARDTELPDRPLLVLLEVLAGQLAELDAAIDRLYEDHFVELAAPEALPRLADLVGARLLADPGPADRGVVGRTLHWRRRKGGLRTLEDVLMVTSGWDAEVDEAFRSLLQTQDLADPLPGRGRTAVLWEPLALTDPLSRSAPAGRSRREEPPLVARRPGETVEQALRRLGRADADGQPASPRTVDLLGWARPEHAVVRTNRLDVAELDAVELGPPVAVTHRDDPAVAFAGFRLDPAGRDAPLVGRLPLTVEDGTGTLTAAHEPAPPAPPAGWRHGLLTPTALAADLDGAEQADDLSVFVDDVRLVGADPAPAPADDLAAEPVGPEPVLRFADAGRPSPADTWTLHLVALDTPDDAQEVLDTVVTSGPATGPTDLNPALVRAVAHRGGQDPAEALPAAPVERAGATVALRLERAGAASGYRRAADGTWTAVPVGERTGTPVSDAVVLDAAGGPVVARLESLSGGGLAVATRALDGSWAARPVGFDQLPAADRVDAAAAADGPPLALAAAAGELVLVGPLAGGTTLGVWRIADPLAADPVPRRVDLGGPRRPPARMAPSVCVAGDRLLMLGGEQDGRVLADLWSVALAGADAGRWTPHLVRDLQRRVGGRLLERAGGLLLVGGASVPGQLDRTVWTVDLARTRPRWDPLPSLPVEPGLPGTLWARSAASGVEVLAWADRTAPVLLRLADGASGWVAGPAETAAPNPPAEGEGLYAGEEFLVLGPPPLPPSELVFRLGGRGRVALLPAVDVPDEAGVALYAVRQDGSTRRVIAPGEPVRPSLRVGAGRAAPTDRRGAPAARLGVPGRLGWRPLRIRQASLGPWDGPVALRLDDEVGLDPRLGRVLLRAELAQGRVSASYRVGRAGPVGAGFAPPDAVPPPAWVLPDEPVPPLRAGPPTAEVDPRRAGIPGPAGLPVVGELADALRAVPGPDGARRVVVVGSPRLAPAALALAELEAAEVVPSGAGSLPHVEAEDGISVSLSERLPGADPDTGPSWLLAGLSLAGAVQLAAAGGTLDLRWCTAAGPGQPAVVVAGAGHLTALLRHTLAVPRVTVRLVGCRLGTVRLPPWARLVAVGCTIDGGDPAALALDAAGATVRLRHCTVNGRTAAGLLAADSCVLAGPVTCDRADLSWLRHSLVVPHSTGSGRPGGRPPLLHRSLEVPVSFAALDPADPRYLALGANTDPAAASAAEHDRTPGAYSGTASRVRELTGRSADFLPLALVADHRDRADADLDRMSRGRIGGAA